MGLERVERVDAANGIGRLWTRTMVLGLEGDWWQALRVETWEMARIPPWDPRLPAHIAPRGLAPQRHFLICPGVQRLMRGKVSPVKVGDRWEDPPKPPPLSRRPRGSNGPSLWRVYDCIERAGKLFLPMCTPRELADARAVQAWLERVDALRAAGRVEPVRSPLELILIRRYGALFSPRVLLCKECLNLRFGKVLGEQLPAEVAWRFPKGRAPELPNPFAMNVRGGRFEHNQYKTPLTKSELKNRKTRKAALERRMARGNTGNGALTPEEEAWRQELAARRDVHAARIVKSRAKAEAKKKAAAAWRRKELAQRLPGWEGVLEALGEGEDGGG